jgi:hypothetical protein
MVLEAERTATQSSSVCKHCAVANSCDSTACALAALNSRSKTNTNTTKEDSAMECHLTSTTVRPTLGTAGISFSSSLVATENEVAVLALSVGPITKDGLMTASSKQRSPAAVRSATNCQAAFSASVLERAVVSNMCAANSALSVSALH